MWRLHIWTGQGLSQTQPAWGEINTQQRRQKVSARERHGLTVRGAIPWKNTHVGSPEGDVWRSTTPDCRGCGRNFNRVRQGELN